MASRKTIAAAAMAAALTTGAMVGATLGNPLTSGAAEEATTSTTVPAGSTADSAKGGRHGGHRGMADLAVAAKVLGMTEAELQTALEGGKSLADVAKDQGVDKQKVIDALVADAEKRLDEAKAELPDRIAAMVDSTMPAGGPGKGGPGMGHRGMGHRGMGSAAAAKALGMTEAELQTAIEGGKSLADIAKDQGVDKAKVIAALVAEAKTHLAEEVAEGHLTQAEADERAKDLEARITDRVDGKAPTGPMGGGHGGPGGN